MWTQHGALLGMELHHTSSYHPQANGMVECFHWTLKASLRARLDGPEWVNKLPWVLLGSRTTPKSDLDASVAELIQAKLSLFRGNYSSLPRLTPTAPNSFASFAPTSQPCDHDRHRATESHPCMSRTTCEVLIGSLLERTHHTPLQRPYTGSFPVIQRGDKTFCVHFSDDNVDYVTVDSLNLIPCFVDDEAPPPQPPDIPW